jgi:hypothetical protein
MLKLHNQNLRLFHGTSQKHLNSILNKGLSPRGNEPSNWEEYPSANDRVYLTRSYAIFFAIKSAHLTDTDPVIIEVIPSKDKKLVADEDYLAQCEWKDKQLKFLENYDNKARTDWWLKSSPLFPNMAVHSLNNLGNCCHMGKIDKKDIKGWMSFKTNNEVAMSHDPTITIMNFRILGQGYIDSLQKFFDSNGTEGKMWEEYEILKEMKNA